MSRNPYSDYIDCCPDIEKVTEDECLDRNCLFDATKDPKCYFPENKFGYKVQATTTHSKFLVSYNLEAINTPIISSRQYEKVILTTASVAKNIGRLRIAPNGKTDRFGYAKKNLSLGLCFSHSM